MVINLQEKCYDDDMEVNTKLLVLELQNNRELTVITTNGTYEFKL